MRRTRCRICTCTCSAAAPWAGRPADPKPRVRGLAEALACRPECVSLFVGPAGGFSAEEADLARLVGAELVTLGPRVLRAETASPVLAALVLYELGDLSWPI